MRQNPFRPKACTPARELNCARPVKKMHPLEDCAANNLNSSKQQFTHYPSDRRFTTVVVLVSLVVGIMMLFVCREIHHSRQLHRMSRLVAAADAERKQWQERQRMQLVREADLMATIQNQAHTPRNSNGVTRILSTRAR